MAGESLQTTEVEARTLEPGVGLESIQLKPLILQIRGVLGSRGRRGLPSSHMGVWVDLRNPPAPSNANKPDSIIPNEDGVSSVIEPESTDPQGACPVLCSHP